MYHYNAVYRLKILSFGENIYITTIAETCCRANGYSITNPNSTWLYWENPNQNSIILLGLFSDVLGPNPNTTCQTFFLPTQKSENQKLKEEITLNIDVPFPSKYDLAFFSISMVWSCWRLTLLRFHINVPLVFFYFKLNILSLPCLCRKRFDLWSTQN